MHIATRHLFVTSIVAVFAFLPQARAQVGIAAGGFQTVQADPQVRALGEATVARQGYPGQIGINPAGIGREHGIQFSSGVSDALGGGFLGRLRSPWPVGEGMWIAAPSFDVRFDRTAFGYQYKHFSQGELQRRDAQNSPLDTLNVADRSHKFATAYGLTSRLTVGAGINVFNMTGMLPVSGDPEDVRGWSADLGLIYRRGFEADAFDIDASAGWSLLDFGPKVSFGDGSPDPIATTMRAGLAVETRARATWLGRSVVSLNLYGALSKFMVHRDCSEDVKCEADGPFKALFTAWKPAYVSQRVGNQSNRIRLSTFDQLIQHTGAEITLLEAFSLRWGRFHEHQYNGARQYVTRGFGIDLYYVALDYSWIVSQNVILRGAYFWRLTGRIPLP